MKRREFITMVGGAAAAWPLAVRAQQVIPVIGFLGSASEATSTHFVEAFRQGLGDRGFVEGRNVRVEYRWADNQYDRLPSLASELVTSPVAVIVASGGPVSALAAKAATSTIPVVFTATSDPVKLGLVASLNRPGGNVTGSAMFTAELDPKRLELLRELAPTALVIGAFVNPGRSDADEQFRNVQQAGRALGLQVVILSASSERDIEAAFEGLAGQRIEALLVGADPFFASRREQLVALAARYRVPATYMTRDFVVAGGLASYGTNTADGYRQAGIYAGQILKGAKPADLPVIQPTKFELVLNLRTAKALGLTVSREFLLRADDVVE
jgi:putative ABC transport system substrate-binding protein